ncbi:hypothetical protein SLEP1_g32130 [Rubroshorea leprosula]|uniref:Uncharacterized protein n=1 Tax=Rubroshorea leprosula TaxID=152421 RepID=A0AAV5KCA9_9ROSI|nr:hypothetical protein SLEP1_g32130 [Rubroshorea leprosula]
MCCPLACRFHDSLLLHTNLPSYTLEFPDLATVAQIWSSPAQFLASTSLSLDATSRWVDRRVSSWIARPKATLSSSPSLTSAVVDLYNSSATEAGVTLVYSKKFWISSNETQIWRGRRRGEERSEKE